MFFLSYKPYFVNFIIQNIKNIIIKLFDMTHEFYSIVQQAYLWQSKRKQTVLATVVHLEGSSYRRPGVRMIINEVGEFFGAVSGGCVEKEVLFQSQSVFKDHRPKMMTYDGTLRLGCEGVIYILIEPFIISDQLYNVINNAISDREKLCIESRYHKEYGTTQGLGSCISINNQQFHLQDSNEVNDHLNLFKQELPPVFQLLIIGAEHDAVQLCKAASALGWKVSIMASADEQKSIDYFPGATKLLTPLMDQIDTSFIDDQTAVLLMTHSYNKDVRYLSALRGVFPAYFGLLGPKHRRERLVEQLFEYHPEIDFEFIDQLRGPAGINIGAESAQEISVSIIAEILSVIRNQTPVLLKDKPGNIHA